MGVRQIILLCVLITGLLIAGCRYTAPAGTECTPPAVKMLDVNGNTVCVLPEIKPGEQTPAENPNATTEAVANVTAAPPITGEVTEPTTEVPASQPTAGLPTKTVTEGDLVSFPNLAATDADGDKITYYFTKPLNGKGEWQTKAGDSGQYRATITASDGQTNVSQDVLILVKSANRPPVIQIDPEIKVKESDLIALNPVVTDPDGDKVTVAYSGWMKSNTYQTTYSDAGNYIVTITATDGVNTVSKDVKITVENVNRPAVLAPIADVTVTEGDKVIIEPTATDPDGDQVQISFGAPLDEQGTWQTKMGDAGVYKVDVHASDGNLTAKRTFIVTVKSANRPPVVHMAAELTVKEGDTVTLNPGVTDPDGDKVSVTYSGWMKSNTYRTVAGDGGTHTVTITASDGMNTVTQDMTITVEHVNRPPVFVPGAFK